MIAPVRLRLSRQRGFDLQAHSRGINGLPAVNVARPGRFGNPFDFRREEYCWAALSWGCRGDRRGRQEASVRAFRCWVDPPPSKRYVSICEQPKLIGAAGEVALGPAVKAGLAPSGAAIVAHLHGRNLACWCAPGDPCHADVLLEIANRPSFDDATILASYRGLADQWLAGASDLQRAATQERIRLLMETFA